MTAKRYATLTQYADLTGTPLSVVCAQIADGTLRAVMRSGRKHIVLDGQPPRENRPGTAANGPPAR